MTKRELVERIYSNIGEDIHKKDIETILKAYGCIVQAEAHRIYRSGKVLRDDYIPFLMLGRIKITISKERKGMNPKTGNPLKIKPAIRIRIKIGSFERECIE